MIEIKSNDRKRNLHTLLFLLMACMLTASVMIKIIDYQASKQVATLSLRDTAPPSGEPLFLVKSSPYVRYLRSAVAIDYDGKNWELRKVSAVYEYLSGTSDTVELISPDPNELSRSYRDYNRDVLNELSILDDPRYLHLPDNITDRLEELSLGITEGMPTPFEKAKAIETYLQVRFDYNLDYIPAPSKWEPNDWFLFETKEGICGNFNSAFVILARASGIPSRLAAGYYLLPSDGDQDAVYASQAHAWAEVGFDGIGWVAFEATPP
jgi:transglutaminase-like putative cysteine protease